MEKRRWPQKAGNPGGCFPSEAATNTAGTPDPPPLTSMVQSSPSASKQEHFFDAEPYVC